MMRLVVLPVAAGVIHVLDGVLADLDRYVGRRLHEELRERRPVVRRPRVR
jgi:hypothetical protein